MNSGFSDFLDVPIVPDSSTPITVDPEIAIAHEIAALVHSALVQRRVEGVETSVSRGVLGFLVVSVRWTSNLQRYAADKAIKPLSLVPKGIDYSQSEAKDLVFLVLEKLSES